MENKSIAHDVSNSVENRTRDKERLKVVKASCIEQKKVPLRVNSKTVIYVLPENAKDEEFVKKKKEYYKYKC